MAELEWARADGPDDPNRCQALSHGGSQQCSFKAVEGTKYCPRHGANRQLAKQEKESIRLYRLAKWRDRLENKIDHPKMKSLNEEVAILRMTLESKLERLENDEMLILASGGVVELIREIQKTVRTLHQIDKDSKNFLDRTQAFVFIQEIAKTISKYIKDEDVLLKISEEISSSLERLIGEKHE